jgi:hypothetical protein
VSIQAYNGGGGSTTISLACTGNPTRTLAIAANHVATLATNLTTACSSAVTVGSTNGWDTNFDNLVVQ